MSKVRFNKINPREKYQIIGDFYEIVANLKSRKEVIDFFVGLFTPSEALMMARRIQIAKKIIQGRGYEEIRKELKVSYQTITKTEKWIFSESKEYDKWIQKCLTRENKNKDSGYQTLLDRYPGHRILKDLIS